MKKTCIYFLILAILTGCAATGRPFSSYTPRSPDEPTVYVYRPTKFANSAGYPTLSLDGKEIGSLKNGGYIVFTPGIGKHTLDAIESIWWAVRTPPLSFEVLAGEVYFIRYLSGASVGTHSDGTFRYISATREATFQIVDKETGLSEITQLNLSE